MANKVIEIPPHAAQEIRKKYNLNAPGRMDEAIEILEKWIKQQNHILNKNFNKHYLEWTIIANKGSLEKSKQQIDRLCTMKTLLPQFFSRHSIKNDFKDVLNKFYVAVIPKMTNDFYRMQVIKFRAKTITENFFMDLYHYNIIVCEYIRVHDYANGIISFLDCRDVNLKDVLPNLNPVILQQYMNIITTGYGVRLKAVHILTESKVMDVIIKTVKPFLSQKIAKRIYVHKTIKELHSVIPKNLLPADYGGNQKSLEVLASNWIEELSLEENVEYMKMISKSCTDESLRRSDKFNDECMGMPGSFRNLKVD